MTVSVQLDNVVKLYGEVRAVDGVSLSIERGELVTLLGPSGCGKTTTLRLVAGLETASEGTVRIAGRDVTARPPYERPVAMVFQSYALFPHLSVLDNVGYGLVNAGCTKDEVHRRAEEALQRVGLKGYGERLPAALSGGQQQRVAVARALVLKPEVLLFDEPLSNLDARLRRQMREDIRQLQKDLGCAALYVTHDQEESLAISDRVVLMNAGCIEQQGPPREIYGEPKSVFAATFVGEANVVPCRVEGNKLLLADGALSLDWDAAADPGPAQLALRPHALSLHAEGPGLEVTVERSTWLGRNVEFDVRLADAQLLVTSPPHATLFEAGTQVFLRFDTRDAVLLR